MIKNKNIATIVSFSALIYLSAVTFSQKCLEENYSMMTSSFKGYLIVLGLCVLLSICLLNTSFILNKKYWFLALGPIIGCILPYKAYSGDFISNMHEVFAYLSFGSTCIISLLNIYKYQNKNYKKAHKLLKIFLCIFFVDGFMFLKTNGVVGIEEYILLVTIVIINHIIYLDLEI